MTGEPSIEIVEDLSWIGKIWQNEGEPAIPYALSASSSGARWPALVLLGDDGVLLHRGESALVQMTTPEIRAWLPQFMARSVRKIRDVQLGALRQWCAVSTDDGPCTHCNATGLSHENGVTRFCSHCVLGRVRKPVWGRIGEELVNLRSLIGPLAHLRGDSASFGLWDESAPIFWAEAWMLILEPSEAEPEQVVSTPFD